MEGLGGWRAEVLRRLGPQVIGVETVQEVLRDPHALLGARVALRLGVVLRQVEHVVAGALEEQPAASDALLDLDLDHKAKGVAHAFAVSRNADHGVPSNRRGADERGDDAPKVGFALELVTGAVRKLKVVLHGREVRARRRSR